MTSPTPDIEAVQNLPERLRHAAQRVSNHCFRKGGDDALMSIPAKPDYDVDLLLVTAADLIERLRGDAARLDAIDREFFTVEWSSGGSFAFVSNGANQWRGRNIRAAIDSAMAALVPNKSDKSEPSDKSAGEGG